MEKDVKTPFIESKAGTEWGQVEGFKACSAEAAGFVLNCSSKQAQGQHPQRGFGNHWTVPLLHLTSTTWPSMGSFKLQMSSLLSPFRSFFAGSCDSVAMWQRRGRPLDLEPPSPLWARWLFWDGYVGAGGSRPENISAVFLEVWHWGGWGVSKRPLSVDWVTTGTFSAIIKITALVTEYFICQILPRYNLVMADYFPEVGILPPYSCVLIEGTRG